MDRSRGHGLRVLGYLLQGGISGLSASEQAVYLRLVWLCGLRSGTCRCGVERLVAWTRLSRTTVLITLRRLRDRGLLRPYTREPKRETA
jgi:predicted transcriptional regulator